jgi:hypothetical protein
MATPYDDTFKIFISENAQDFLSWLVIRIQPAGET